MSILSFKIISVKLQSLSLSLSPSKHADTWNRADSTKIPLVPLPRLSVSLKIHWASLSLLSEYLLVSDSSLPLQISLPSSQKDLTFTPRFPSCAIPLKFPSRGLSSVLLVLLFPPSPLICWPPDRFGFGDSELLSFRLICLWAFRPGIRSSIKPPLPDLDFGWRIWIWARVLVCRVCTDGSMDKYELVKDIGSGNFGVARLMRNKETKELVAMKYIERGRKVLSFSPFPKFSFQLGN